MKSKILEALINHSFFDELDSRELHFLTPFLEYKIVDKGETLYTEEEKSNKAFFIIEGVVGLYKFNKEGKAVLLSKIGKNKAVGEIGLIDDAPRFVTAYTEEKTKLLIISRYSFEKLCKKHPFIANKILKNVLKFYNLLFQKVFSYYFNNDD